MLKKQLLATSFLTVGAMSVLPGCTIQEVNCVLGGKKPESCNLYSAKDTEEAPLDQDVIILGDSMWDYGKPLGAIPKALIELSGKTYYELARSGATADYIRNTEIPRIPGYETNEMTVKTILISGGANDVREPCKVDLDQDINTTTATLTQACIDGVEKASNGVQEILQDLHQIESLQTIVWGGLIYFPDDKYSQAVSDAVVDGVTYVNEDGQTQSIPGIKDRCETPEVTYPGTSNKCYYADLRYNALGDSYPGLTDYLWLPEGLTDEELATYSPGQYANDYLFDGTHVNEDGAQKSAEQLWFVLTGIPQAHY